MLNQDIMRNVADAYVRQGIFAAVEWYVEVDGKPASSGVRVGEGFPKLPDTPIYRIYSMTKPIVAFAALRLIEQGRLRLYDPAEKFLPEFANPRVQNCDGASESSRGPILVEHLLTHRAGLSYGFNMGCHVGSLYARDRLMADTRAPLAEFAAKVASYPLAFHPGSQWRYSLSIDVLAAILEISTGQDLPAILDELVFSPLGMSDTGFSVPSEQSGRILPIYGEPNLDMLNPISPNPPCFDELDMSRAHPWPRDSAAPRGGHGLFSTIPDYANFARSLIDGNAPSGERLISTAMLEFMLANRIPDSQLPLRIGVLEFPGYGWNLLGRIMLDPGKSLSLTAAGEIGWAGAASTFFWVDRSKAMVGLSMTQYLGSAFPLGPDSMAAAYSALDA
ncbi:MAG: serine hydrolase [Albidovulum sp.]|nr:serine hydrolase [Albidovulum sp.]